MVTWKLEAPQVQYIQHHPQNITSTHNLDRATNRHQSQANFGRIQGEKSGQAPIARYTNRLVAGAVAHQSDRSHICLSSIPLEPADKFEMLRFVIL